MQLKKKKFTIYIILFFLLILTLFFLFINNQKKEKELALKPISINLLTSVHPKLPWSFKPINSKIIVVPGEVTKIEYVVENLKNEESTGIATFAYFPRQFENYFRKINCFCYDAKTLKPKQKDNYALILLIDPEVTKDSKTKHVKEVTIQFTFFDYKEFKKNKT